MGAQEAVQGAAEAVGSLAVELALRAGTEVVGSKAARAALEPSVDLLVDTIGGESLRTSSSGCDLADVPASSGYTTDELVPFDRPRLLFFDVKLLSGERDEPRNACRAGKGVARNAAVMFEGGRADGRVVLVPGG